MSATVEQLDDHSGVFGPLRSDIVTSSGQTYRELRSGLEPRWIRVWADLAATLAAVMVVPFAMARVERRSRAVALLLAPVGAAAGGVAVHRLGHFLHEGAHFNVARGKTANDRLTNAAVGVVVLTDVRAYRAIHMAHHRRLGHADDPERSYLETLDTRFVLRGLLGARLVFSFRQRLAATDPQEARASKAVPVAGALLHGAIVLGLLRCRRYASAGAWAVGVGSVYPLLNTTRQLLEHRAETDGSGRAVTGVTRMFTSGPLSPIVGGVGFNRHLLHHWDASISYTRLSRVGAAPATDGGGPDHRRA